MSPRFLRPMVAIVTVPLVLAGCGGQQLGGDADTEGPYRVFFTADMTGPVSSQSRALLAGVRAAVDEANENGGIGGRTVELIENNDQNNPTSAVSALQAQIASGSIPDLVYPGGSSAVSLSLLPITTREEILSLGPTVASQLNDPEQYPYHFGTALPVAAYVNALAEELREADHQRVAMVFSNDPTGQASEETYREVLTSAGFEFESVGYASDALDMTPQLEQLRATDPDVLVFDGYGTAVQYVMRSRAGLQWDIPSYGTTTSSAYPLIDQLSGGDLENVFVVQEAWTVGESDTYAEVETLAQRVADGPESASLEESGVRLPATSAAIVHLAMWAAEESGGATDGPSIADTLTSGALPEEGGEETPWVTDAGGGNPYRYTSDNHFPSDEALGLVYIEPGSYDDLGFYRPGQQ